MSDTLGNAGLLDLEVPVEVWLASEEVPLEKLLDLEPGHTLPLARNPDGPVQLVVNGAIVATGELVVVEGHFGFRVTESTQRRIADLGARSTMESRS